MCVRAWQQGLPVTKRKLNVRSACYHYCHSAVPGTFSKSAGLRGAAGEKDTVTNKTTAASEPERTTSQNSSGIQETRSRKMCVISAGHISAGHKINTVFIRQKISGSDKILCSGCPASSSRSVYHHSPSVLSSGLHTARTTAKSIINTNSRRRTGTVSLQEQETAKKRKEKKWVNWTAGKQEKGEVGDLGESQAAAGLKTLWCDEE